MTTYYWHNLTLDGNPANSFNYSPNQDGTGTPPSSINGVDNIRFNGTGSNHNANCTMTGNWGVIFSIDFTGYTGTFADAGFVFSIASSLPGVSIIFATTMSTNLTGTMQIIGTAVTFNPAGKTIHDWQVSGSTGSTIAITGDLVISGVMTLGFESIDLGNNDITFIGNGELHNVVDASGTANMTNTGGTWTFNGTGCTLRHQSTNTLDGFPSIVINEDLMIDDTISLDTNNSLTIAAGKFLEFLTNGTMRLNGTINLTLGAGAGFLTAVFSTTHFGTLTLAPSTSTLTIQDLDYEFATIRVIPSVPCTINIPDGFHCGGIVCTLNNDTIVNVLGSITCGGGSDKGFKVEAASSSTVADITINIAESAVLDMRTTTTNGYFECFAHTFGTSTSIDFNPLGASFTILNCVNMSFSGGTLGTTINMGGNSPSVLTSLGAFGNVTFIDAPSIILTGSTQVFGPSSGTAILPNLITSGTGTITLSADLRCRSYTQDTNKALSLSTFGTKIFNFFGDFRVSTGTIANVAGITLNVDGNFVVKGLSLNPVSAWTLNIDGYGEATDCLVRNSNASGSALPVYGEDSTDVGSNTNWVFVVGTRSTTSSSADPLASSVSSSESTLTSASTMNSVSTDSSTPNSSTSTSSDSSNSSSSDSLSSLSSQSLSTSSSESSMPTTSSSTSSSTDTSRSSRSTQTSSSSESSTASLSSSSTGQTFILANASIDETGSVIRLKIFGSVVSTNFGLGFTIVINGAPAAITRSWKIGDEDGFTVIGLRIAPRIEQDARIAISYDREVGELYFTQTPVLPSSMSS